MLSKQTREELEPLDSERAADMYEDAKDYDQVSQLYTQHRFIVMSMRVSAFGPSWSTVREIRSHRVSVFVVFVFSDVELD